MDSEHIIVKKFAVVCSSYCVELRNISGIREEKSRNETGRRVRLCPSEIIQQYH